MPGTAEDSAESTAAAPDTAEKDFSVRQNWEQVRNVTTEQTGPAYSAEIPAERNKHGY